MKLFEMKVVCPRCKRVMIIPLGNPDIECNCHLYCQEGELPSDCSVTWPYEQTVNWNWPRGLKTGRSDYGDSQYRAMGYCSTHENYYYKDKVIVDANWQEWNSRRAPKKLRMGQGEY